MDETLEGLVKVLRHPLRLGALWCAAVALVVTFASGSALFGTVLGVMLGLIVGEAVGQTRARLGAVLASFAAVGLVGWVVAQMTVGMRLIPSLLGPSTAMHLSALVWYTALFFALVGAMRALSVRKPAWTVVELAFMAGAFAALFSAHRGGAIARPLWLSDRAWRLGFDPANVLLAVGGVFAVVLAALLLLESKRRLSALAAATIPLLALLIVSLIDVKGLQQPPEAADLAEIQSAMGDPPQPTEDESTGENQETGEEPEPLSGEGDEPQPNGGGAGDGGTEPQESGGEDEGEGEGAQPGDEEGGGAGAEGGDEGEGGGGQGGEEQQEGGGQQDGEEESEGGAGEEGEQEQETEAGGEGEDDAGSDEQQNEGGEGEGEGGGSGGESQSQEQSDDESEGESGPPEPVAVVLLGDDYTPLAGAFYLRQEVHSEFVGTRLIASSRPDVDQDVLGRFPYKTEVVNDPPSEEGRTLIHGKVALLVDHPSPFALTSPLSYQPMRNPNPQRFVTAYGFESLAQTEPYESLLGREVGDADWSEEVTDHYLEHPLDTRYFDLTDEILAELPEEARADPFTRAIAIKVWLDKNVKYSMKEKHDGVTDPTADFLFGNRIGYCVHNAHAAVYLWRIAGIPARVGTGYMVDESGRRGSSLIVTNKDAHAWPELYIDGLGWVVMDISPSENLDPPGQPMDEDLADILADMARMEALEDPVEPRDYSWLRTVLKYTAIFTILGLIAAVLLTHWTVKLWRRWRILVARSGTMPRVGYRVALDLLAESGLYRFPGETRERFARRVGATSPAFAAITDMHLSATLGDPERPPEGRPELDKVAWKQHLRQLRRELSALPWHWRLLGMINPFSFYRSR